MSLYVGYVGVYRHSYTRYRVCVLSAAVSECCRRLVVGDYTVARVIYLKHRYIYTGIVLSLGVTRIGSRYGAVEEVVIIIAIVI